MRRSGVPLRCMPPCKKTRARYLLVRVTDANRRPVEEKAIFNHFQNKRVVYAERELKDLSYLNE